MATWEPIPGETPIDPSGCKLKWVRTRSDLNRAEFDNIRKAAVKYMTVKLSAKRAPFTLTWVKKLHREMFGHVWKWAGQLRTHNLNLGCQWQHVEVSLENLLKDLPVWQNAEESWLSQAAMLHHRAVHIRPFQNGNGRWSRLLANIWLRLNAKPITRWPEDAIGERGREREQYLEALRNADNGEYSRLVELHRQWAEVPLGWLQQNYQAIQAAKPNDTRPWLYGQFTTESPEPPTAPGA